MLPSVIAFLLLGQGKHHIYKSKQPNDLVTVPAEMKFKSKQMGGEIIIILFICMLLLSVSIKYDV